MTSQRPLLLFGQALSMGLTLTVGTAQACKCVQPMTPARQYERAITVVTGVVDTVEPVDTGRAMKATVLVERAWKNVPTGPVIVFTDGTCAIPLVPGQHYLLYLQALSPSTYATDRCSGSAAIGSSQRALRWLQQRASSGSTKVAPSAPSTNPVQLR